MTHESAVMSFSTSESLESRRRLFEMMGEFSGSDDEKERSLGLFLRGSLLARILAVGELYQKIVTLPGMVLDVGTWRGQTAVLCENYRAIYEPLHFNRRIACFDTFEGYKGFSEKDRATQLHRDGTYGVGGEKYAAWLRELLAVHEKNNAMGHVHDKHFVVEGDVRETLPKFFQDHPHEVVALAFFDLNSRDPTEQAFKVVSERLVPGGIIAFWQLTRPEIPAEGMTYESSILRTFPHEIARTTTYPGLCFIRKTR